MKALVTGAAGLIGTETCIQFADAGYEVYGIDNDMRSFFFGEEASTVANNEIVYQATGNAIDCLDIRDRGSIERQFKIHKPDVIIHTAAQPSHDWAARDPHTDFEVNAFGTLNLLQATREYCPDSTFIHCSTSKVYGEHPNELPLVPGIEPPGQSGGRFDLPSTHPYFNGIDTTMSVDLTKHSLFGVSKLSGDLLVQEFGRYFGIPTVCFRPGCLTGGFHQGTEMHGWLSYLMRCAVSRRLYTIYGYDGFQVRCNIHSKDLVGCFLAFSKDPSIAAVYNIGGGRAISASMNEAIAMCEEITGEWTGEPMHIAYDPEHRIGDHKWWISSNADFERDYPGWSMSYRDTREILREIHDTNVERWSQEITV